MQYALVNGRKSEARRGTRGKCPLCGHTTVPKCGPRVMHHWAHASRRNCDPWWENETEWHREWKALFPEECREVSHTALDGEVHRADVKTPTGIVIEVQHSSMTDQERESREVFYRNLIWILDGRGFESRFEILERLPAPDSEISRKLVWWPAHPRRPRHLFRSPWERIAHFVRLSDIVEAHPEFTKASMRNTGEIPSGILVWSSAHWKLEEEIEAQYIGHHLFYWTRPRRTWLDAGCPVYVDFGDEILWRIETYDETGMKCVRPIAKQKLVHDAMVERRAEDIATRFYPIT